MTPSGLFRTLGLVGWLSLGGCQSPTAAVTRAPDAAPLSGFAERCAALGMVTSDCQDWSASVLPDKLPPALGNRVGDDENAAKLGFDLFFDLNALSQSTKPIRCAVCHTPERAFANNVALPVGVALVPRNAPSLTNAARSYPHFWDGRADSLWSQPLFTIENEDEMNGTRLGVAHQMAASYRAEYEKVFGELPDLTDTARFPAQGKPGTPEWDGMAAADRNTVSRVYSNVGKALEAYVRKIAFGRSAVDRFIAGDLGGLTEGAQRGMAIFTRAGCRGCHSGSNLSDGHYHALDLPLSAYAPARRKTEGDLGRATGRKLLLESEFNSLSEYFDRKPGEKAKMEADTAVEPERTFLTPSLRNVGNTVPYGHNGVFTSLEAAVRFMLDGGGPNCTELVPYKVTDEEFASLLEFLNAFTGDTAPLPWSFWPPIGKGRGAAYDAGAPAPAGTGTAP